MLQGKKVLFVHSSASLYGSDRCLLWIAEGLIKRGMVVHAVLPFPGPLCDELEKASVTVHIIDPIVFRRNIKQPREFLRFMFNLAPAIYRLRKLVTGENFDLVHTNTSVTLGGAIAARLSGVPHIWHIREILAEFGFMWTVQERMISHTSREIICISEAVAAQFTTERARQKLTVVNDGIPLPGQLPSSAKREAGRTKIITVGLLAPYKGQDILIRAVRTLIERGVDVELSIIGDVFGNRVENRETLESLVARLGIEDRVRFLGFQSEVNPHLRESDIFVLPSTRPEGLGLVILEAMAMGVPVVASNIGGVLEIIRQGDNGILVAPGNAMELANGIEELIHNPGLVNSMRLKGFSMLEERFSVSGSIDRLTSIYEKVISH